MSNDISSSTKVATKFKELAAALGQDIEDVQVKVQEDFGTKTLDGKAIKEAMEEDATKGSDDTEGDDQSTTEDTIVDGEVKCDECGTVFDSKQGFSGHLSGDCSGDIIGDDEKQSTTEPQSTTEDEENDTEGVTDQFLLNNGVQQKNLEAVRKYRSKNGVCSAEGCEYGANKDSKYCASCKGSSGSSKKKSSKSKTSNADQVGQVKDLFEVSQLEAEAVVFQVSEGNYDSHSEAVKNHL